MAQNTLRIEQYETVLYNANQNPLGIPVSVKQAIANNIGSIIKYPDFYYKKLKQAISEYVSVPMEQIVIGNGSQDLLRLFTVISAPKKALVLVPSSSEYERTLANFGCEIVYYNLPEEDFRLNTDEFVESLDSSIDLIILGNPNNPTSQLISLEDIKKIVEKAGKINAFLVIDEMYIEFVDDYEQHTAISLLERYNNLAIIRNVSKFFAVPGLRFAYALMNNPAMMRLADNLSNKNNIATLSAIAGIDMFKDEKYIEESRSMIHTERSLIYRAMQPCRSIKIYQPEANFMLVKLLRDDINSKVVAEHCNLRGIVIRRCDDVRGLGDKYIRFCFMNPKQNDLMVNTILEIV